MTSRKGFIKVKCRECGAEFGMLHIRKNGSLCDDCLQKRIVLYRKGELDSWS